MLDLITGLGGQLLGGLVVIGGLVTSTLLTLLVLPVLYRLLERELQGAVFETEYAES